VIGVAQRVQHEQRDQRGHEHQVNDPPRPLVDEPDEELDAEQESGWSEHQREREDGHVEPSGAARGEELGVVGEQVEQRLRHGERAQSEELRAGHEQLPRRGTLRILPTAARDEHQPDQRSGHAHQAGGLLLPAEHRRVGAVESPGGERRGEQRIADHEQGGAYAAPCRGQDRWIAFRRRQRRTQSRAAPQMPLPAGPRR
jgi:hypothetical protein